MFPILSLRYSLQFFIQETRFINHVHFAYFCMNCQQHYVLRMAFQMQFHRYKKYFIYKCFHLLQRYTVLQPLMFNSFIYLTSMNYNGINQENLS